MAALRIARASTGRDGVIFVGYNGQHNDYIVTTPKRKGVPTALNDICAQVKYGDREAMYDMFSMSGSIRKEIAAVVIEPYIYEEPGDYLKWVVDLAHRNGSLVIFDEVVTGFRTKEYSAQKMFGITPDLACFGKAMGNGMPISFVCGKNQYMSELQGDCFVSGTFGGELLSMAAALATIKVLEEEDVIGHIWKMGQKLKDGYNEMFKNYSRCIGYPCRTFFELNDGQKGLLWENCLQRGVLFGYAQFINYSHKEDEIDITLDALRESAEIVKKNWDDPVSAMKGKCPVQTFRQQAIKR
jgi:glutamate-1-semialdehyde 2,1-aminomutase/spore coat polysaccharide biosynthesis protein SpsF